MKPLAPNTLLQNRYLIVHLIGKGGMGEVYLAVDQRLGSAMALKRTFFNDDETLKAAFEREAKILAMLRHSVLPKVSDHFIENDVQYLVMEHISGDDLSKRLEATNQPFPVSWVLFWADQLLDALAYLHSHEPPIIHRDIKPQNLKLTNDNHVILLDFGLAKNSIGETRLTTSGTLSGYTPNYASMEQIRGTGTTAQSDIYSLCATLYQLLTNTVPPDALYRADSALNNLPDPVVPISQLNPEVSKAVSDVILRGFSLSADRRYKSAREMQAALRAAHAQVQEVMSANTIAFNVEDIANSQKTPSLPQSQMETEVYTKSPSSADLLVSKKDSVVEDIHIPLKSQDFDATMPYDPSMAAEKTEYVPFNNPTPSVSNQNSSTTNYASNNDFSVGKQESFAPKNEEVDYSSTVPLIKFDQDIIGEQPSNKTEVVNFRDVPPEIPQTDKTENFKREEVIPREESKPTAKPAAVSQPAKKSSGKMLAIVGGLLVFAIVGIVAAGVGIYILKPEVFGLAGSPTPSPSATPSATPTPEITVTPTPEPTLESVPSIGNTSDSNTSSNTTDPTNTNTQGSTSNQSSDVPTPRPTIEKNPVTTPTVKTPITGPTKVPPTPKPTKATPATPEPTKQTTRDPKKVV